MKKRGRLARIGPAFIVGATIIGPGSVTLMSTTGANYGYSLLWISLLAGAFMAGFLALFMRFGIYCDDTFLEMTGKKLGRWYAVLVGITIFGAASAFQFGNALGVTAGMQALFRGVPTYVWPVAFTAAAILFMFGLKKIYGILEKMMTFFLIFMVVAFLINLVWAKPDLVAVAKGAFIPSLPKDVNWVTIGGLVGTTFILAAAFFQSYLVRAKGWTEDDLASGIADTVLASVMLTMVGTVIMITAAAVVYPHEGRITFEIMIGQLDQAFGGYAKLVFGLGFFAAAFSSFITNSLAGGVLLSDGLGLGGKIDARATKAFATCVLLIGMTTAMFILHTEQKAQSTAQAAATEQTEPSDDDADAAQTPKPPTVDLKVAAIRIGQASTMLAVPLGAIAMVLVLFDRRSNKGRDLPGWAKVFVLSGFTVLIGLAITTATAILPEIRDLLAGK